MTAPRLLSVADVARELGVDDSSVYRLIQRDGLPAVRIGSRVKVERTALEAFIAAGGEVRR